MNTDDPFEKENLDQVNLPQWLAEITPEPRDPVVIEYIEEDGKYAVYNPAVDIRQYWDTIDEAYINAHDHNIEYDKVGGIVFSNEAVESVGRSIDGGNSGDMIFLEDEKGVGGRILIGSTDEDGLKNLKYSYKRWNDFFPYYESNPHDFMTSYSFLDSHPVFWIKERLSGNKRGNEIADQLRPYDWITSGLTDYLRYRPYQEENGKVVHTMEAGSHIAPEYDDHYHDYELDIYSDSYENAIIEMAAVVHKFFHPDGTERKDSRTKGKRYKHRQKETKNI